VTVGHFDRHRTGHFDRHRTGHFDRIYYKEISDYENTYYAKRGRHTMNKEQYYVQIPVQAFCDARLTRAAICVYGVLIAAADKLCKVEGLTVDEIATRCCIGEKTVRRAEAQLCAAGYIKIEPTGRGSVIWVSHDLRPQAFDVFAAYKAAAEAEQIEKKREALGI
jgi:hypothetical protein